MWLDRITFRILKRKLLAWLRLKFRSKPVAIPKIHIPTRVWGDTDERREEALYLAAPRAFWLRPDRGVHDMPCWQIEGEYAPKPVGIYNPATNSTRCADGSQSYQRGRQNAQASPYQRAMMAQEQAVEDYQKLFGLRQQHYEALRR